jgi:hypothetical protein
MTTFAPRVAVADDGVGIERLVGDQRVERALDERCNANRIETLSRQEREAHKIAERIGERLGTAGLVSAIVGK